MDQDSPPNPLPGPTPTLPEVPFGVNEMRLNARQWLAAVGIIGLVVLVTPRLWQRLEQVDTRPDYRIPYQLSKDYWFYGQWLRQVAHTNQVVVLGDSVVWGEYVLADGTLSHFLNQEAASPGRFINGGVNGLFPIAQDGLLHYYAPALRGRKVIVQCNVLWMTSPKADLSTHKEEQFNHSRLVPQFFPRIPCYRADANERLSAIVERRVGFVAWVGHLQNACFGQESIPSWTLETDGGNPPRCPNAWRNPLSQITLSVSSAPRDDPQRGPGSPRHKPWFDDGDLHHTPAATRNALEDDAQGTTRFEWVELGSSLQWQAFQRVIGRLRERGNDVLVVLGPFNEHIMAAENRPAYRELRGGIVSWLKKNQVPHVVPETLPSALYADASHPLTEGYELLARRLYANQSFREWLSR